MAEDKMNRLIMPTCAYRGTGLHILDNGTSVGFAWIKPGHLFYFCNMGHHCLWAMPNGWEGDYFAADAVVVRGWQ